MKVVDLVTRNLGKSSRALLHHGGGILGVSSRGGGSEEGAPQRLGLGSGNGGRWRFWAQGRPRLGSLVRGVEKGEGEASLQSK